VDFVLGTKHIPLTLLIGIFLLCWGAFGLLSNRLFGILHYPGIYVWPSLVTTFFASSIVTRSMAAVFGRFLPTEETYGVTRFELVGSLGKAIHATNEHTGTIDIKDKYGTVHRVQAKVEPGKDSIPSGAEVIVVDYDEDGKYFLVRQGSL
jgi:membrane protein implicated in regulation of membrane protease activity